MVRGRKNLCKAPLFSAGIGLIINTHILPRIASVCLAQSPSSAPPMPFSPVVGRVALNPSPVLGYLAALSSPFSKAADMEPSRKH